MVYTELDERKQRSMDILDLEGLLHSLETADNPNRERINSVVNQLVSLYTKQGNPLMLLDLYIKIRNMEKVREIAESLLDKNRGLETAAKAFKFLGDKEKVLDCTEKEIKKTCTPSPNHEDLLLWHYLPEQCKDAFNNDFEQWCRTKGFKGACVYSIVSAIAMADKLLGKYDLGVGIAKGGLYLAYVFDLFGLDTRIVECHYNPQRKKMFRWVDELKPEDIEGKKIIVLENDVATGSTLNKVLKEINKYNPTEVALALTSKLVQGNGINIFGGDSAILNIPDGYSQDIWAPNNIGYDNIRQAILRFENILERKHGK